MAPTYVQSAAVGTSGTSTACTFSANVTAGNLLLMFINGNNGVRYTSASDNLNSDVPGGTANFYKDAIDLSLGSGNYSSIYYAIAGSSAACTVTAFGNNSDAFGLMFIAEYSGIMNAADPLDGSNALFQTNQTLITSNNFTTTASGDLIVGYFLDNGQGVGNSDNGFALRNSQEFGTESIKDMIAGAAGSYAALSNAVNGNQFAMGAAFKVPSLGPVKQPNLITIYR